MYVIHTTYNLKNAILFQFPSFHPSEIRDVMSNRLFDKTISNICRTHFIKYIDENPKFPFPFHATLFSPLVDTLFYFYIGSKAGHSLWRGKKIIFCFSFTYLKKGKF